MAIFVVFALRAQELYHAILAKEAYEAGYMAGGEVGYKLGRQECYVQPQRDETVEDIVARHRD